MRILLDTNIFVSGLLSIAGPPYQLLVSYKSGAFKLVTSSRQIAEFERVLSYPHLSRRISRSQINALMETIDVDAVLAEELLVVSYSPDPDDNFILATAIAGQADLVVSGDKRDMLALGQVEGIQIVTAREAVSVLQET